MTKLEELKAARDAARADARAAYNVAWDADTAYAAARDAYEAELKKVEEEEQDD
jgi:hypothetical protein